MLLFVKNLVNSNVLESGKCSKNYSSSNEKLIIWKRAAEVIFDRLVNVTIGCQIFKPMLTLQTYKNLNWKKLVVYAQWNFNKPNPVNFFQPKCLSQLLKELSIKKVHLEAWQSPIKILLKERTNIMMMCFYMLRS